MQFCSLPAQPDVLDLQEMRNFLGSLTVKKWIVRLIGLLFLILAAVQLYLMVKYWPAEITFFGISLGTMQFAKEPILYKGDWLFLIFSAISGYYLVRIREFGRRVA